MLKTRLRASLLVFIAMTLGLSQWVAIAPANAFEGSVPLAGFPTCVAVVDGHAYVTSSTSDLSIVRLSDGTVLPDSLNTGLDSAGLAATANGRLFVTSVGSNRITVIDTATKVVAATINNSGTAITVGNGPRGVAVSPNGTRVYASNYISDTVSVIDVATGSVVATVDVGDRPIGVGFTPDGTRVYVANEFGGSVSVIDTNPANTGTYNTVIATVPVGSRPNAVAFTPNLSPVGFRAYVSNGSGNTVSVIDTNPATGTYNTVIATVPSVDRAAAVAITPDGTRAYVPNDGDPGTVSVINTTTNLVIETITVGAASVAVAINPDGTLAYVTNKDDGTVSVIDTDPATGTYNTVINTITGFNAPVGVAVTPDGTRAYVTNKNNAMVSVVDTTTSTVNSTVSVGSLPGAVAVSTNGAIYVTNEGSFTVSVINSIAAQFNEPKDIAVGTVSGRQYLFVANIMGDFVTVIDAMTNLVVSTVTVPGRKWGIVVDGNYAYVPIRDLDVVAVVDITKAVNDPANAVLPSIAGLPAGSSVVNGAVSNGFLYVNAYGINRVLLIDLSLAISSPSTAYRNQLVVGQNPFYASTFNGKVYVSNQGGDDISVIDPVTRQVVSTITDTNLDQPGCTAGDLGILYVASGANGRLLGIPQAPAPGPNPPGPEPVPASAGSTTPTYPDLFVDQNEAIAVPGRATLFVGTSQVPMSVTADAANTGVNMSMGQWEVSITPTQPSGALPLGPNSELRTKPGQTFDVDGNSYLRGTSVNIYIMSTPILIGVAEVTPRGTFQTTVTIPPTINAGKHTIQIVGVNPGNELSRASLGVLVVPATTDVAVASPIGTRVAFIGDTTQLTRLGQTSLLSLVGQVPANAAVTRTIVQIRVAKAASGAQKALARQRAASVTAFLQASGVTGPFTTRIVTEKGKNQVQVGQPATARVSIWFTP